MATDTQFALTRLLLSIWCVISSLEWFFCMPLFRADGFLSFRVLGLLRRSRIRSEVIRSGFYSTTAFSAVLVARIASAMVLLCPTSPFVHFSCCLMILFSCFYIDRRSRYGTDGSDQMALNVAIGTALSSAGLALSDRHLALCGVFLITGQATLAYAAAGVAKLVSPVWRNGSALLAVMQTQTYGHAAAVRMLAGRPRFSKALCWTIIAAETLFPLTLLMRHELLLLSLGCFALFHLANAIFMGLNTFVWSFLATYPSVILANEYTRHWLR